MNVNLDLDDFFIISNLSPRHTGLPFVVWISPKGGAQHDVRVKVSRGLKVAPGEFITVTAQPTIAVVNGTLSHGDLTLLRKSIELNRDVLIRFWDGDIEYTEGALEQLRSI